MSQESIPSQIAQRFRGFLPVVVDVETGGFNPKTDALLEIAATLLDFNDQDQLAPLETLHYHILPFEGANVEHDTLKFLGIKDPFHPFRFAEPEEIALNTIFKKIKAYIKATGCQRAVLVGHNPAFDLSFLQAAVDRQRIKGNPFHRFTTFDTATLSAVAYGQTVLAKALNKADIEFDTKQAHGARYDTEKTAELFCKIINNYAVLYNETE